MLSSLYIGKSGLDASRYSVEVASNNISNENTEGYIKRVVNTSELSNLEDDIGNGVSFDGVSRSANQYLYDQLVSQNSQESYYIQEDSILSNIETMFSETDSTGLSVTLSDFFSTLESLRSDSSNIIYQNQFSTQAENLVNELKSLNDNLDETINSLDEQLSDQVSQVNSILENIVYLNEQIRDSNIESYDLIDKRDLLEKELSNYVNIEVDRTNDNYNLKIAGVSVIFNNTNLSEISINEENIAQKDIYDSSILDDSNFNDSDEILITLNNTTTLAINANVSGSDENELKNQIVDAINNSSEFSEYTAYLDSSDNLIIKSNIEGVEGSFDISISINDTEISKNSNSIEAQNDYSISIYGKNLSLTNGSIKSVVNNLSTSTSKIYEYKDSLNQFSKALVETFNSNSEITLFNGSDVNTLNFNKNNISSLSNDDLEKLSQILWNNEVEIGNESTSFKDFYQNLLVTISSNVENNNFKLESTQTIINSLEITYDNLTKVDPDEEMINLLQYQAAYEASAKVITTIDEMLQTLLNM